MRTPARTSPLPRRRHRDRSGCIVTWVEPDGTWCSLHADGFVLDALREITDRIPIGSYVSAISTPRSIRNDLRGARLRAQGQRPDPWAVERNLLGQIGRRDLLPDEAKTMERK